MLFTRALALRTGALPETITKTRLHGRAYFTSIRRDKRRQGGFFRRFPHGLRPLWFPRRARDLHEGFSHVRATCACRGYPRGTAVHVFHIVVFQRRETMQRYSLIGAIALLLSLIASQMLGQDRKGPLGGAAQNAIQAVQGASRHAAGAAGEAVRREGDISPVSPTLPNLPAGSAGAGADLKQGSEGRIQPATIPGASPALPPDPKGQATVFSDNRPDPWRYRLENGRWWYWTPQNQWMWYGDNGWVAYDSAVPYTAAYGSYDVPGTGYYSPYPGAYYYPGYYYRPGVYVGVGGVRVGVGGGGVRVRVGGVRYR